MKTKTRPWGHIHDIGIPRLKNHDIEIPRPKNHDINIWGLTHHDIEKRRQLSDDIVIPRHFFRGWKATTSGFQNWKTTTSRFQGQKVRTSSFYENLTLMHLGRWNSPSRRWGDFKKFQQTAPTRRTQLGVPATTIRFNGSSQLLSLFLLLLLLLLLFHHIKEIQYKNYCLNCLINWCRLNCNWLWLNCNVNTWVNAD